MQLTIWRPTGEQWMAGGLRKKLTVSGRKMRFPELNARIDGG